MASSLYIVLLRYSSIEAMDQHLPEHQIWVERQAEAGHFLLAGPTVPRGGGVIMAQVSSRELLEEILREDPYSVFKIATHEIVEFAPGRGTLRKHPGNPLFS
jgi:uncharacterized protein YciI